MLNVTCVTTFHEPGLKQYGQRFIDSFSKQVDPQIKLIGGLAAILELAVSGQQKTAIQMDSGVGRVFMVAGAGFEPATFRLSA